MAAPTLERNWEVVHDGTKWQVLVKDNMVPQHSELLVCAIPFTLPDAEAVARAIATLPDLLRAARG